MKLRVINPLKTILIFGTMVFLGCQSPVTSVYHGPSSNASLGKGLTVSWSSPTTSARTIMPSSFPTPATYNISLTPTSGNPVTRTGVTSTSWTFSNLTPSVYAVTVVGLDGSGNTIVQGTSSVDTTTTASASVSVTLNYALTGTGTGQINLTLNLASAGVGSTTATVKLVDPLGNISSPTLVGSGSPGSNFTYSNTSAAVGSWQAFFMVKTGTQTAMKMESILVFQNVPTTATLTFASSDFNATYVQVSSISLSKNSSSTVYDGQTDILTATLNVGASNTEVVWTTSSTNCASVSQSGLVTIVAPGPIVVTITATSVDNPLLSASCVYSVPVPIRVLYFGNGSTSGTAPIDNGNYYPGEIVTILGNLGNLAFQGSSFLSWNTSANLSGSTFMPGQSTVLGSSTLTLYANWVPLPLWGQSVANTSNPSATASFFVSVLVDSSNNIYGLCNLGGDSTGWNFGAGASFNGYQKPTNAIVKYNSSGEVKWVQTLDTLSAYGVGGGPVYSGLAIDSPGNVYTTVYLSNPYVGAIDYGNGVSATSTSVNVGSAILKYDTNGNPVSITPLPPGFGAQTIFCDSANNIYVNGFVEPGPCNFGNGVVLSGSNCSALVMFDSNGTAQWGVVASTSSGSLQVASVSVDSYGSVYVGAQAGPGTYSFGNGVSISLSASLTGMIVKFSNLGIAQWGIPTGPLSGLSLDSSGNVYITIVNTNPTSSSLSKYSPTGLFLWSQVPTSNGVGPTLVAVANDIQGNCYVVGYINYSPTSFGGGISFPTNVAFPNSAEMAIVVKYNSNGQAQWAQGVLGTFSALNTVATTSGGNIIVGGWYDGGGSVSVGNNTVTILGSQNGNQQYQNGIVMDF